ncbi:hypothetical protein Sj15T_05470 [Sphingobium sp. TA15]|nr:hypothetical protein Sj15T_05470 [Sphingobium sp. TA15]
MITRPDAIDRWSNGFDYASTFVTRYSRQGRAEDSVSDEKIGMTDTACLRPHENF